MRPQVGGDETSARNPIAGVGWILAGILAVFLPVGNASAQEGIKATIEGLTGGRQVRIVWGRDTSAAGNHVFGNSDIFRLVGYDSADDMIRVIRNTLDDYSKPLITADGQRVVYTDRPARQIYVIDWSGNNRQALASGYAGTLWFDPGSGKQWVYFQEGGDGDNASAPLKRFNLDNPSEVELVWDDTQTNAFWMSISGDGARIASSWPWSTCGVVAPAYDGSGGGTAYHSGNGYYANGCWTTISPDTSYRVGVFDGPHRAWRAWDWPTGSERTFDLHSAPGISGWEIYHPKHSNDPRFLTMTGPYDQGSMGGNNIMAGGPQIEVYLGKQDAGFTQVTDWVRITNNGWADIFPCAWVDQGVSPVVRIDSFSATPATIGEGNSADLSWQTTNATSVSIDQGLGSQPEDGSVQVSPNATTTYTLTAQGQGGPVTRQTTVTVVPAGTVDIKVNCGDGSPAVAGWEDEDPYRTGGNTYDFSDPVDLNGQANAAPSDVYRTCIHTNHSYDFPVADGTYTVRLHFFDNIGSSGRAMDYTIEGVLVLDDFSIISEAGAGGRALVKQFQVVVGDGNGLQIVAEQDVGNDTFETGIEILSGGVVDDQDPTIAIASPADGATVSGDLDVTGTATDNAGITSVQVSLDGGAFDPATGTDAWTFRLYTSALPDGPHTVTARATDAAGNTATDSIQINTSNEPRITILRPAGGEIWQSETTEFLQWTTEHLDNVTIFYSLDGGTTYQELVQTIFDTDPDWGNYSWQVPVANTDRALIQIQGYFGEAPTESELFQIVGPVQSLVLTSPQAGETLIGGQVTSVVWTAEEVDSVALEYSLDGGSTWDAIGTVDLASPQWGDTPWTVPNVRTDSAVVRAGAPGGGAVDDSGLFSIVPAEVAPSELEVTRVRFGAKLPDGSGQVDSIRVADRSFPVEADGSFEAEVDLPAGADGLVVEMQPEPSGTVAPRRIRIDLTEAAPPIPGLGVSAAELRAFFGGRSGVLAWVDVGGRIQVLDFRENDPQVRLLSNDLDCVNPILSPDGTRVVYSQGPANQTKFIKVRTLAGDEVQPIANGDVGYWHFDGVDEYIVYCDWSDKEANGADGATHQQKLITGGVLTDGQPIQIHSRAMDAGPNASLTWLGQVYENLWAYELSGATDVDTAGFFLLDGSTADHQTCNGSMAPDSSARLMALVIPHDWVRVYSHQGGATFRETSRFNLPNGFVEWEFPEWSTDVDYFTAVLRGPDQRNRLFVVRMAEGELVPDVLEVTGEADNVSYSHLFLEP